MKKLSNYNNLLVIKAKSKSNRSTIFNILKKRFHGKIYRDFNKLTEDLSIKLITEKRTQKVYKVKILENCTVTEKELTVKEINKLPLQGYYNLHEDLYRYWITKSPTVKLHKRVKGFVVPENVLRYINTVALRYPYFNLIRVEEDITEEHFWNFIETKYKKCFSSDRDEIFEALDSFLPNFKYEVPMYFQKLANLGLIEVKNTKNWIKFSKATEQEFDNQVKEWASNNLQPFLEKINETLYIKRD